MQAIDVAEIANESKNLVACKICGLFEEHGCDNCKDLTEDTPGDLVSPFFDGLIAMMNPMRSWAARRQRIARYKPGCYAVVVSGSLTESTKEKLDEQNIQYVCQPFPEE